MQGASQYLTGNVVQIQEADGPGRFFSRDAGKCSSSSVGSKRESSQAQARRWASATILALSGNLGLEDQLWGPRDLDPCSSLLRFESWDPAVPLHNSLKLGNRSSSTAHQRGESSGIQCEMKRIRRLIRISSSSRSP
jgi:hypothetical protein